MGIACAVVISDADGGSRVGIGFAAFGGISKDGHHLQLIVAGSHESHGISASVSAIVAHQRVIEFRPVSILSTFNINHVGGGPAEEFPFHVSRLLPALDFEDFHLAVGILILTFGACLHLLAE